MRAALAIDGGVLFLTGFGSVRNWTFQAYPTFIHFKVSVDQVCNNSDVLKVPDPEAVKSVRS